MKIWLVANFTLLLFVRGLAAQSTSGELRVNVTDSAGAPVPAQADIANESTSTHQAVTLHHNGHYRFRGLPFGFYRVSVSYAGLAPASKLVEVRSSVPVGVDFTLKVQSVETSIEVKDTDTLIDPARTDGAYYVGSQELRERPSSIPGRGLLDLVMMQPGWTFESNGILHPRESEYETQFVVNGFPLYDNRSPAFAPSLEAENVESLKVYTSGIPAEFGQKVGGVIEVNTQRNTSPGFHGTAVIQGGSFGMVDGFLSGQYVAGRTTTTLSGEGFFTDRYLDPPTIENYTNHASKGSGTAMVERDLTDRDRLRISFARREIHFQVPDDLLQYAVGQRQDRSSANTEGQVYYQRVISPSLVGTFAGMVRDVSAALWSNPLSTPISAHQDRGYREGYIKANVAGHAHRHEWKAGVEARFAQVREEFGYNILAYRYNPGNYKIFDRDTPPVYEFNGQSPDREQSAYVQDMVQLGKFTFSLGLRFDHYALLVDRSGWSPRIAASWHSKSSGLVLHASYDRTFGTPPFENILVSGAPSTAALNGGFYLPVNPARGNYYEAGVTKSLGQHMRLDVNYFRRDIRNFQDDDLLLNTGVSFPITYHSATVRGTEVKLQVPKWGRFSGYLSYANTIGVGRFPISGGLFLNDNDTELLTSTDHFPITQDMRNTARAFVRYQITPRLWTSWSAIYNSGLPVEGDEFPPFQFLILQYGASVVDKVNFSRGRVVPNFSLNASAGIDLWKTEHRSVSLQGDMMNITDRLNVINFAGLLSGTGVAPPRSFGLRLRADF